MTNFNFVLGDFDWDSMLNTSPVGSYIYYILFVIVINLVLFNILLAITIDGYEAAKVWFSCYSFQTK